MEVGPESAISPESSNGKSCGNSRCGGEADKSEVIEAIKVLSGPPTLQDAGPRRHPRQRPRRHPKARSPLGQVAFKPVWLRCRRSGGLRPEPPRHNGAEIQWPLTAMPTGLRAPSTSGRRCACYVCAPGCPSGNRPAPARSVCAANPPPTTGDSPISCSRSSRACACSRPRAPHPPPPPRHSLGGLPGAEPSGGATKMASRLHHNAPRALQGSIKRTPKMHLRLLRPSSEIGQAFFENPFR